MLGNKTTRFFVLIVSIVWLGAAVPTATAAPMAYVLGGESGNVLSIFDTTTNALSKTHVIDEFRYGFGVEVGPTGQRVYITGRCDPDGENYECVKVLDAATLNAIGSVRISLFNSFEVAIHPDGKAGYVASWDDESLRVFDTADLMPLGDVPVGTPISVAIHPHGHTVYVSGDDDVLSAIDATTLQVVNTLNVPGSGGMDIHPGGSRLYLAGWNSGEISVIDTSTFTVVDNITITEFARGLAVHPTGMVVYAAGDDEAWVIDSSTNSVITNIAYDGTAEGLAIHPSGEFAYIPLEDGQLLIVDTATNSIAGRITVPANSSPSIASSGNFVRAQYQVGGDPPISARMGGLDVGRVVCTNVVSGQSVTIVHDPSFDCEAAGLATQPGNRIHILVQGRDQ